MVNDFGVLYGSSKDSGRIHNKLRKVLGHANNNTERSKTSCPLTPKSSNGFISVCENQWMGVSKGWGGMYMCKEFCSVGNGSSRLSVPLLIL